MFSLLVELFTTDAWWGDAVCIALFYILYVQLANPPPLV